MPPTLSSLLHDPDRTILHRALRVALVVPLLFALGLLVLHDPQFALIAAFGSFAALAMADFMGPRRSRLGAHVVLAVLGTALVVVGTLLSNTLWPAVLVMLAVGVLLQFAVALGGQFALGNNAAILSFVVAVMVPAPDDAIPSRIAGWLVAMVASAVAATFLWPRHERRDLYQRLAEAIRPLAAAVRAVADGKDAAADIARAHTAIGAVREVERSLGFRPIGPPDHQRALLGLVDALGQAWRFTSEIAKNATLTDADRDLARAVAKMQDAIADVMQACMTDRPAVVPAIDALTAARHAHREVLDGKAHEALVAGMPGREVVARYATVFPIRVLSYVTLSMAADGVVMAGGTVRADDDFVVLEPTTAEPAMHRAINVLKPHLSPSSVWLHNSLRAGLALALAVFVAKASDISHAFWVVLATLSILRSNVATTGATVLSALVGTFAGFLLATLAIALLGAHPIALWLALPFAVFVAGYAPYAISFGAGQAMFALLVVILFNLMVPDGWSVGVVRLEAVSVGAIVALVTSLIMWPKGASAALRDEIAAHARAGQRVVALSFGALDGAGDPANIAAARDEVLAVRHRAEEALAAYIGERGTKRVPLDVWGLMARVPISLRVTADGAIAMRRAGYVGGDTGEATRRTGDVLAIVCASYGDFADRLANPAHPADTTLHEGIADLNMIGGGGKHAAAIYAATAAYVDAHREDPATITRTMAIVWGLGWLAYLAHIRFIAEPALVEVQSHAQTPWWK